MPKAVDSVIFDFGGPVVRTPFEMVRDFERRRGLPERTLDWGGPFDPDADRAWRKVLSGELKERDYWRLRAKEFARFTGSSDIRSMLDALYDVSAELAVRPEAEQMLIDIKTAGLRSAILTNDMGMFHSPQFLASVRFIAEVDVVVDASTTNVLKPDPRAYLDVLRALGSSPQCAVFTDDMPHNIRGANAVGMCAIWFDVRDPRGSYAELARAAGFRQAC
ncbi:HAD-IA family hydrolase [Mycolicibacterium gadium]|uniref:HAD-IA family hydrolase n=1 Tax=Mycolicibacterium gadium TaxID=1794 RepID=A0ABT6H0G4_MYCGU|nr:HAD-IA family hydrolase [Mycolicibacterium gadium]MDG5486720.1 HAD-IA family hydrolase [Mycolicibacterium gadium]